MRELVRSGGWRDVRVGKRWRRSDEIDGDWLATGTCVCGGRVGGDESIDAGFDVVEKGGIGRGQIAAGGTGAFVKIQSGVGDGAGGAGASPTIWRLACGWPAANS